EVGREWSVPPTVTRRCRELAMKRRGKGGDCDKGASRSISSLFSNKVTYIGPARQ
ncbi:MAG: hypothetical protein RI986_377, partial [Planctomycetota bacterium]